MIAIREERYTDVPAREALLDASFGPARFAKTCERLREGREPARGLALVAEANGTLLGTVRLWHVSAGAGCRALMLGPLAVDPARRGEGVGSRLIGVALARAAAQGHDAVLLVGDEPYYRRFGFTRAGAAALSLPGPFERERFLARELVPGALAQAEGLVLGTGMPARERPVRIAA